MCQFSFVLIESVKWVAAFGGCSKSGDMESETWIAAHETIGERQLSTAHQLSEIHSGSALENARQAIPPNP